MKEDFNFYGNEFNYIVMIWMIGYVVGEIFSNLIIICICLLIWILVCELIWFVLMIFLVICKIVNYIYVL